MFNVIGPVMYGLAVAGMMGSTFGITLAECFVFSSLIVAVDPVAVRRFSFFFLEVLIICDSVFGESVADCEAPVVVLL